MLALSLLGACGSDTDFLGESPEEAASDLAQSNCDAAYDCGLLQVTCGTPNTATRIPADQFYESRADCEMTVSDAYVDLFTGCAAANLSDAQRDTLNDCLNSGAWCPPESEFQSIADAVCSGTPPPGLSEACQQSTPILERCSQCANGDC